MHRIYQEFDYHIFTSMAHFQRRRRFDNVEQVEAGCLVSFSIQRTKNGIDAESRDSSIDGFKQIKWALL